MPKAAGSSSTRSTPNSSPRKAQRKAPVDPGKIDKSNWRASKISPGTKINKSAATANYHLNAKDIEGLEYEKTVTVARDVVRPMFLYQERDIEWKAWEKYGSPEAFEIIMIRDAAERKYDASTPKLLEMKQKLQREGKEWLWKEIINAYHRRDGHPGKFEQEWAILPALENFVSQYPRRSQDDPTMSTSGSFAVLREVLSCAPVWDEERVEEIKHDFEITSITFPDLVDEADWTSAYCNEVYDALSGIIAEHGVLGWKQARWMVYGRRQEGSLLEVTGGSRISSVFQEFIVPL